VLAELSLVLAGTRQETQEHAHNRRRAARAKIDVTFFGFARLVATKTASNATLDPEDVPQLAVGEQGGGSL